MAQIEIDDIVHELEQQLRRYPADAYPIQHATAQFHLGVALANAGRVEGAIAALRRAADLFQPQQTSVEHAKALNALGAALRLAGQSDEAIRCFERAARLFDERRLPLEQGAAYFNLGLARRDASDGEAAIAAFRRARELLDASTVRAQAGAAARELGVALLGRGKTEEALTVLSEARELAEEAGDLAGLGGATNALGLAYLGAGNPIQAARAFRDTVGANPRSVRPQEFAMAKANLALAYEQAGDHSRARLAALQALAVPELPPAVREQGQGVIDRLGTEPGEIHDVLDEEPAGRWLALMREELIRWADSDAETRAAEAAAWVEGALARTASGAERAEAWLGGLLEMPPEAMERVIYSTLEAAGRADDSEQQRWRADVAGAMVRFPVPQWTRLKEIFNRLASELGQGASWS